MKGNYLFFYQSGLCSATIVVFIAGGNRKMTCGPIGANALIIAQVSYDLMGMLNGTDAGPSATSFIPRLASIRVIPVLVTINCELSKDLTPSSSSMSVSSCS